MSITTLLAVGIAGFFGAITRYLTAYQISLWLGDSFPYATLFINASGSLILGFSARYLSEHLLVSDMIRIGWTVGFLGAFTTFSTFSYESVLLMQEGEFLKAGMNIVMNGALCLSLCFVGLQLTKIL